MSADEAGRASTAAGSLREGPAVPPEESAIGCRSITKTFGSITAVDDVSLAVEPGE